MPKYTEDIDFAYEMLEEFGASFTMTRDEVTHNPIGGTNTTVSTTQTVKAVVLPSSSSDTTLTRFDDKYKDAMVKGRWRSLLVAGKDLTFEPREGYKIAISSENYRIVGAMPLNPSDDGAIIYTVGAMRE